MKILVCGSRNWTDTSRIHLELSKYPKGSTLVHGGCRGADLEAENVAYDLEFNVKRYDADWNKYGKSAGPKRNQEMIDKEGPFDLVLAFHEDLEASKGTKDMVGRCMKYGFRVKIIS
jgi:hypothetical protein